MKKSMPARLPRNEVTQMLVSSMMVHLRCRKAVIMNYKVLATTSYPCDVLAMMLLVNKSAPLRTIMISPTGKKQEPMVLMSPGAFSWYHGAVSVASATAQLLQQSVEHRSLG